MRAREWFEAALAHHKAVEALAEQTERLRASIELGAIRYDSVSGGSNASPMEALLLMESDLEEERQRHIDILDAAIAAIWGVDENDDRCVCAQFGNSVAYSVHLRYLEGMTVREISSVLDCSISYVSEAAEKAFRWLDLYTDMLPEFSWLA